MHPFIWRLAGFVIFMLATWIASTVFLLLPWPDLDWSAPVLAAVVMARCTALVGAGYTFFLGVSWLINPPEQD